MENNFTPNINYGFVEKKINFKEICEKYGEINNNEEFLNFLNSLICSNMITPYTFKVSLAEYILELANTDRGVVRYNSTKEEIIYKMFLFSMYSYIDNCDFMDFFDELSNKDIDYIEYMISIIKEMNWKDYLKFEDIFKKKKIDFEKNNRLYKINLEDVTNAVYNGVLKGSDYLLGAIIKMVNDESFQQMMNEISQ